jgi:uncharacterized HhH-GPD family protein
MTTSLRLSQDESADDLLARSPFALMVGMLLDQQFPMERAFAGPYVLAQRLGHEPDAAEIAAMDPERLVEIFAEPPVIHRYPRSMAERVQQLAQTIVADYDGDPEKIWRDASTGAELVKRLNALPGYGKQKAQIFTALLGKQLGVQPSGWREAAGHYGDEGSRRSIADITGPDSLAEVRAFKKEQKAKSASK